MRYVNGEYPRVVCNTNGLHTEEVYQRPYKAFKYGVRGRWQAPLERVTTPYFKRFGVGVCGGGDHIKSSTRHCEHSQNNPFRLLLSPFFYKISLTFLPLSLHNTPYIFFFTYFLKRCTIGCLKNKNNQNLRFKNCPSANLCLRRSCHSGVSISAAQLSGCLADLLLLQN